MMLNPYATKRHRDVFVKIPPKMIQHHIDLFYRLKIREDGKGITTAGCVRDDMEKSIQNMFPVSIQNGMSEDTYVGFEDFATDRTAIFIITSPVRTAQDGFANLLFGIAIRQLMEFAETQENNRLPRDAKLFFDDFSCGFPIQNDEKSISTFRAAGLSSMTRCQSPSQLDAAYGQDYSTVILDTCSSLVCFPGGMNKKACSYISYK